MSYDTDGDSTTSPDSDSSSSGDTSDSGGSDSSVSLIFGANANRHAVSSFTITTLKEVLSEAGEVHATITSTARNAHDQARAMFQVLEKDGASYWKKIYKAPGRRVIDAYTQAKQAGSDADAIRQAMEDQINQEGPSKVSLHCADFNALNVVDIARSSLSDPDAVQAKLKSDSRISKVLVEKRALHVEIPQSGDSGTTESTETSSSSNSDNSDSSDASSSSTSSDAGSDVTITFGPNAARKAVSAGTLALLKELLASAGESKATITSTARNAHDQARAMYQSLEKDGADYWKKIYKSPGRKVIDVYQQGKDNGDDAGTIKQAMEDKINELGPSTVSRHCADFNALNVVDIARSSLSDPDAVEAKLKSDSRISKVLVEKRALHVEVPQDGLSQPAGDSEASEDTSSKQEESEKSENEGGGEEKKLFKKEIDIAVGKSFKWKFPEKKIKLKFVELQFALSVTAESGGTIVLEEGAEEASEGTWIQRSWKKIKTQTESLVDVKNWKFGEPEIKPLGPDGELEEGKIKWGIKLGIAIECELGPVKGEIQFVFLSVEKSKGEETETKFLGLEAAFKKEFELEEIALGAHAKLKPLTISFEAGAEVEPDWEEIGEYLLKVIGEDVAEDAAVDTAVAVGVDAALTVGIVAVGVGAVVYACYSLFKAWQRHEVSTGLAATENGAVAGFMDGVAGNTKTGNQYRAEYSDFDEEAYNHGKATGQSQRKKLIADHCGGDASKLDGWLKAHSYEVEQKLREDFDKHSRPATFEAHVSVGDSLSTVNDWWCATMLGPPKSIGQMPLWEKYRGNYPDGFFDTDHDRAVWSGDDW